MAQAKRGRTKVATGGTTNKVLLGVRVPEEFHGRVLTECAKRGMSLQKLVTSALLHYFNFKTPAVAPKTADMDEWLAARESLKQVWEDYLDKMPLARIGHMYMGMSQDLVQGVNANPSKKETKMLKAYAARLEDYTRTAATALVLNPRYAKVDSAMARWMVPNPLLPENQPLPTKSTRKKNDVIRLGGD